MIAQFPIENHSDQGQFAELSLKTIGKSEKMGDYCAIRSNHLPGSKRLELRMTDLRFL